MTSGYLNTPIALSIAGVKAGLVALWFMHLKNESKLTALVAAAGLLWLTIMFVLTLADYFSRQPVIGWE
ncbi:MAG: cytochrome C oxidase subunit IV family protein [Myxococcota bacterium]